MILCFAGGGVTTGRILLSGLKQPSHDFGGFDHGGAPALDIVKSKIVQIAKAFAQLVEILARVIECC